MTNYDFTSLSSFDFEVLVRDILQKELSYITLESFKSGRDEGIDLRYSKDRKNEIIVQCKHYANSKFSDLINSLKNELPKIQKLKPKRYLIVTSLGLTPANKTTIINLCNPYIQDTGDIIGGTDLNNLLGKFPEIEKKHFKLWLSSEAVLSRVLHNDIYNITNIGIDNIKDKIKYYVQNQSFSNAKRILDDSNYCIIAGSPGIGKTTLAEMLILDYLAHGYGAFKISSINDALKVYNPAIKQVFYFDDFLGQTSLEQKLNINDDEILISFITRIRRTKNTKFILTTREYILNQAKMTYEKLSHSDFDHNKCIINLSDYTSFNKAEILYNHLYFSGMPKMNIEKIIENKNYLRIITHPNYSPRIIEWMTKLNTTEDTKYVSTFLGHLDNPSKLWEHAFEYQITEDAQRILIVLSTLTDSVLINDLETAFNEYNKTNSRNSSNTEFKKALRQLEGNFINIRKVSHEFIISYSNPSIRDFIENYLNDNLYELRKLCHSLYFFDQHISLWNNKKCINKIHQNLSQQYMNSILKQFNNDTFRLRNLGVGNNHKKESLKLIDRFVFIISAAIGFNYPLDCQDFIDIENQLYNEIRTTNYTDNSKLPQLLEKLTIINFQIGISKDKWIDAVKDLVFRALDEFDTYELINKIDNIIPDFLDSNEIQILRNKFNDVIDSEHRYYLDQVNEKDYIEGFCSTLEEVSSFLNVDSQVIMDSLSRKVQQMDESSQEFDGSDFEYDYWKESRYDKESTTSIESLFDSLK
ncbi:restriction endonuclease [Paenibacillus cellulosilyticus]|uniref:Restriction endonuclease n=1 Tax=Paenibacillus cellulosilyticus TaxID=375489 RepID=A0A2V2YVK0_9BACL|nr:restriction endonuclease [Paenibacillus cellulosilyticus]PWW00799.1 restriction endonuclease [Paenibacillus cellulosilyticus]QKS45652.1 restriction endonuclease [Paenibacillus cellulosilyticus]